MNVDRQAQALVFNLIRKNHPSTTPKAQRPTMRQTVLSFAALALSALASPALAETISPGTRLAEELSQAFEQVAEGITPSVVTISTETKVKKNSKGNEALKDFLGEDFMDKMVPTPQRGLGTGVIVDEQGHILTNNHVIGDADEVTVRFSN
jgi:serine protease Do